MLVTSEPSKHEYGRLYTFRACLAKHRESVAVGELRIQNNEIVPRKRGRLFTSRLTVGGHGHVVVLRLQVKRETRAQLFIVFDYENAG